jgi:hypothetical protein
MEYKNRRVELVARKVPEYQYEFILHYYLRY